MFAIRANRFVVKLRLSQQSVLDFASADIGIGGMSLPGYAVKRAWPIDCRRENILAIG